MEDQDKEHFRVGAAVDCLLTSPERFGTDFRVVSASRPYGLMGKFITYLPPGIDRDSPTEMYEEAYTKANYRMSIGWVINNFWNNQAAVDFYYSTVDVPEGVIIISREEEEIVNKAVELLTANPFTRKYFFEEEEGVELLHQVPVYFRILDTDVKSLLDGVRIDHNKKTVEPFDLKTSYSVSDFPSMYVKMEYFLQASLYELAIAYFHPRISKLIQQEGYELLNFKFIVSEKKVTSTFPAMIYETTKEDRQRGLYGGYINGKYHKGVYDLIEDYKWHVENNYWTMPKELYESEGVIQLEIFDKITTELD